MRFSTANITTGRVSDAPTICEASKIPSMPPNVPTSKAIAIEFSNSHLINFENKNPSIKKIVMSVTHKRGILIPKSRIWLACWDNMAEMIIETANIPTDGIDCLIGEIDFDIVGTVFFSINVILFSTENSLIFCCSNTNEFR